MSDGVPPRQHHLSAPTPASYRLEALRSMTDEMRAQGLEVTTQVLRVRIHRMIKRVAESMGFEAGERALRLERLRLVNGQPVAHQVSWVVEPYAERIRAEDFGRVPLYAVLAGQCGVEVASASEVIRPELLAASLAPLLRRAPGSPVFVSERITRGADGVPLVHDTAVIDGYRMRVRADRVAGGMSLSWQPAK